LLVGDYLAMPKGKGGYKEIGLYLDMASQWVFSFKYKTHGSAKTTTKALQTMFQGHAPWEVFMSDGGSHFDNEEVRQLCAEFGVETEIVTKYSPWVNGLIEGTNRILLAILKRMCAPDLGEEWWKMIEKWEDLPANWPEHFDNTIFLLNNRILRALDHTPNKLFFGMVINTTATGMDTAAHNISLDDIEAQQAYVQQQRFDCHARAVVHGAARKKVFDEKVLNSKEGEVVLDPKFKKMFLATKKILPEWSGAFRVKEHLLNSYIIETIYEQELDEKYNTR
jgi:transposase InsO family protein